MKKLNSNDQEWAAIISDIIFEREKKGISQAKLSEMTGLKQSAISRMENLSAPPQIDTLIKVLNALDLKLNILDVNNVKEDNGMKFEATGITRLKAEFFDCLVTVSPSDDGFFRIVSEHEEEFIFSNEEENILVITQKKRKLIKKLFSFFLLKVELKIPKEFNGDFVFSNNNGKAAFEGITVNNLNARNGNGKLALKNIKANKITGEVINGKAEFSGLELSGLDITVRNGRTFFEYIKSHSIKALSKNGRISLNNIYTDSIDLKSGNGSIIIDNLRADSIKAVCTNGRIIASVNGNETEYSLDVKSVNGKNLIAGKKTHGQYVYKDKDKVKNITASTVNGSVIFVFSDSGENVINDFKKEIGLAANETDETEIPENEAENI